MKWTVIFSVLVTRWSRFSPEGQTPWPFCQKSSRKTFYINASFTNHLKDIIVKSRWMIWYWDWSLSLAFYFRLSVSQLEEQISRLQREKNDLQSRLEEDQEDLNELMKKHKAAVAQVPHNPLSHFPCVWSLRIHLRNEMCVCVFFDCSQQGTWLRSATCRLSWRRSERRSRRFKIRYYNSRKHLGSCQIFI